MSIDYEQYWKSGSYQPTTLGRQFWDSIQTRLPKGQFRLLDFGCGNGAAGLDLRSFPCIYEGVDVSKAAVESGCAAVLSCRIISPGEPLPFEAAAFDVVLSSCVVEHIVDASEAYRPVKKLLRPGGMLILRTNNMMH